jgi:hypothetical protein
MSVNAAAKAEKSQERFYDALRDLFVGVRLTPARLRIQSCNVRP